MVITVEGISANTIAPIVAFQISPDSSTSTASTSNRVLFVTTGTKNTGTINEVVSKSRAEELYGTENGYNFVNSFYKNYERPVHVLATDTVANAIAKIGDERFDIVATTLTATADLTAWKNWTKERFNATQQNSTQVFISKSDTVNNLSTFGDGLDDKHLTVLERSVSETETVHLGAVLGAMLTSADNDPALPFNRLAVEGITPPEIEKRFSFTERNLLLGKGVSTFTYDDQRVYIDMLVTTYKTNASGNADTQFRDLNDILNSSYLRRDLFLYLIKKYPRYKAGEDGGNYSPTANVLTPKTIKSEVVNKVKEWEESGYVQEVQQIIKSIIIEKSGDRFSILFNLQLISQARQIVGVLNVRS